MEPQWRQQPRSKRPSSGFLCFHLRRPTSPIPTNLNSSDPSSPKVSCIGQVRVKTSRRRKRRRARNELRGMKHGENSSNSGAFRSRSLRRSDYSWSWVHLPLGCACVALRRLVGSLFCGMWRCGGGKLRSTCCCCMCACEVCGEERSAGGLRGGGGGLAVVAEEKGKSWGLRELEMVADKLEKGRLVVGRNGGGYEDDDDDDDEEEEDVEKNAMMLMRCRSDPTKMSALAACFVDSGDAIEDKDGELAAIGGVSKEEEEEEEKGGNMVNKEEGFEEEGVGFEAVKEPQIEIVYKERECGFGSLVSAAMRRVEEEKVEEEACNGQTEIMARRHSSASAEKERKPSLSKDMEGSRRHSFSSEKDVFPSRRSSSNREGRRPSLSLGFSVEKDAARRVVKVDKEGGAVTDKGEVANVQEEAVEKRTGELPDCLLLMMYEPKLSMEVSRETWVCTADFLRWQPRHWQRMKEKSGGERVVGEEVKKGASVGQCEKDEASVQVLSSEEEGSGPSGHFALLTRCKSEPARLSSATASQKGCFWRSRYEPTAAAAGDVGFFTAASK